jgi:hypothetical protein
MRNDEIFKFFEMEEEIKRHLEMEEGLENLEREYALEKVKTVIFS